MALGLYDCNLRFFPLRLNIRYSSRAADSLAWKLAPALAAGNTVIVKPSEMTPLTTCLFFEKCLDHLPPGVVNLVLGYGPDVAEPLVSHPDVPLIAFTGSLATGQRIASIAALMMKTLHLELGGKDAFVVEPDVDIENSVYAVAYAALINCGQVCTSTERVFIASEIAPRFTEAPTILSTRYTHPEFAKRKNKE